jgi:hypothetical protein
MRPRTLRVVLKYLWYLCVLGFLVGAYYLHSPDAFVRLPSDKDPAIFGDWYVSRGRASFQRYTFRSDGTGEIASQGREPRKFWWGTEGEKLQMKYQSYRGWTAPLYEYWQEAGGQISVKEADGAFTMKLVREPPESSKIQ